MTKVKQTMIKENDDLKEFIQTHRREFEEEPSAEMHMQFHSMLLQQAKRKRLSQYVRRSVYAVASLFIIGLCLSYFQQTHSVNSLPPEMRETYSYYLESVHQNLEELKTCSTPEEYANKLAELKKLQNDNRAIVKTLTSDNQSTLVYAALISNFQLQKQILTCKNNNYEYN